MGGGKTIRSTYNDQQSTEDVAKFGGRGLFVWVHRLENSNADGVCNDSSQLEPHIRGPRSIEFIIYLFNLLIGL